MRVADGLASALRVADGLAPALRVADGLALGDLTVAVELGELPGDADVLTPGDNVGGVAGGDAVQATTDAEARMVAKPTADSLALNPVRAVAARIFMDSSHPRRIEQMPRNRRRKTETDDHSEDLMCCPDIQWLVYH